ncbi:MAG: hypothetical protein Q4P29_00055 [Tissierellia bacterium]|nr:hypothetical protein [Tissierellia bacterium]
MNKNKAFVTFYALIIALILMSAILIYSKSNENKAINIQLLNSKRQAQYIAESNLEYGIEKLKSDDEILKLCSNLRKSKAYFPHFNLITFDELNEYRLDYKNSIQTIDDFMHLKVHAQIEYENIDLGVTAIVSLFNKLLTKNESIINKNNLKAEEIIEFEKLIERLNEIDKNYDKDFPYAIVEIENDEFIKTIDTNENFVLNYYLEQRLIHEEILPSNFLLINNSDLYIGDIYSNISHRAVKITPIIINKGNIICNKDFTFNGIFINIGGNITTNDYNVKINGMTLADSNSDLSGVNTKLDKALIQDAATLLKEFIDIQIYSLKLNPVFIE